MSHLINADSNCYQLFLSIVVIIWLYFLQFLQLPIWILLFVIGLILYAIGLIVLLLIEFPFPKSNGDSDPEEV